MAETNSFCRADRSPSLPTQHRGIIGVSPWAMKIRNEVATLANFPATVLITGPSGTGKELLARAVHDDSPRSEAPFVAVDCASATGSLFASQLFGHEKGAFTGASHAALGVFRAADGGTVFLDEMGELELELQAKLLRVLQERVVVPVGSVTEVAVDVRVVAATNRNLVEQVQTGRFREDLFYRLRVATLETAPLVSRIEDIQPLVQFFLARLEIRHGIASKEVSPEMLAKLIAYHWPGNVRELENVLERATLYCRGPKLLPEHLPEYILCDQVVRETMCEIPSEATEKWPPMEAIERSHLLRTLDHTDYHLTHAAQLLQMDRNRLRRRANRLGVDLSRSHSGRRPK